MTEQAKASANIPSILPSWTRILIAALQERGVDTAPLLADAGLDAASLASEVRIPLQKSTVLWQQAARATGDEALGIWASKYMSHTTFHAMGYAFMASRSLYAGMERLQRFSSMISSAISASFTRHDDYSELVLARLPGGAQPANEAMEAALASLLRASRMLAGRELSPTGVTLTRQRPTDSTPFDEFFRCEINYGGSACAIAFRNIDLDKELSGANEELAQHSERLGHDYLARMALGSVSNRLRGLIVKELPSGMNSRSHYAAILGMSDRSLQRKLSEENSSFKQILNDTRCELAKSYLESGQFASLTEIAFLLGFSDSSSFSRAFQRWTGTAPSAYTTLDD